MHWTSETRHMDSFTPPVPRATGTDTDLQRLRARVARARSEDRPGADTLVQDLETAYEELRVADEEVRSQHEAIQRLVESHQGLRLQQERTMAILPVPIVVTDMQGLIRSVNAAAATLVGARVSRLLRKPVFTLFSAADRHDLRRLLSTTAREGQVLRRTATLLHRTGEELAVEISACVQFPGAGEGEISWMLMGAQDRSEEGRLSVASSLTQLAVLPHRQRDRVKVLEAAVEICRDGLGGRAELSIALGSPLAPVEVVSTSQAAQAWDGAQIASGQGPSESAFRHGVTTSATDVRTDPRWPRMVDHLPDGHATVLATVVAAAIKPAEDVAGTVTAYVDQEWPGLEDLVELFALTLGGVLHELDLVDELERLETDMQRVMTSRAVIDQAKGIVMATRGVDAEEAWQHLVHLSSTRHVKVRDVAEEIVSQASGGA